MDSTIIPILGNIFLVVFIVFMTVFSITLCLLMKYEIEERKQAKQHQKRLDEQENELHNLKMESIKRTM